MGGRGPNGANHYPQQHVHYQIKDPQGHLINPQNWWDNLGKFPSVCTPSDLDGNGIPDWQDWIKEGLAAAKKVVSPLVLDLNGDGLATTALQDGAYFDHDGNGFAESTGWVNAQDGILARDLNGNGTVDNGGELFGSETLLANGQKAANGYDALAELDTNQDGKIDQQDAAYSTLKIWKDIDGDGYSSADELDTLADAGVQSIGTGYTAVNQTDANGNTILQTGTFTRTDNSTGNSADIWFNVDKTNTIATDWLPETEAVAALPEAPGFGNVYDLHQAILRDSTGHLQDLVSQFAAETDPAARDALVTQIVYAWTGAENIDPASRGTYMDARKLSVLEKFLGEGFVGISCYGEPDTEPNSLAGPQLTRAYNKIYEMVYGELMAQTQLKGLYDLVTYTWDQTTRSLKGNLDAVAAELQSQLALDSVAGKELVGEFARSLVGLQAGNVLSVLDLRDLLATEGPDVIWAIDSAGKQIMLGTTANDGISGSDVANDALQGNDGNDMLYGNGGDDTLYGGAGGDTLFGGVGDDLIWGGAGNDTLIGGESNDAYLFERGSGQDMIVDNDSMAGNIDTIRFAVDVAPGDIALTRNQADLYLTINGTADRIIVQNWFASDTSKVEQIQFADGTVWDTAAIQTQAVYLGTSGNDGLTGTPQADTFDGGAGNDYLVGGAGNDAYLFGRGSGQDMIADTDNTAGNIDTIRYAADVAPSDVTLSRNQADLFLTINGTTDKITVQNWFASDNSKIEQVQFADGTVWDTATIQSLAVYRGTINNDSIVGTSQAETFDGGAGNDYLVGGAGNDVYLFDRGTGQDMVVDTNSTVGNIDTIRYAAGLAASDITVSRNQADLFLTINGTSDKITVQNWFAGDAYKVEQVQFADGTVWDTAVLQAAIFLGTDAADNISGTTGNDVIEGLGGNDTLNGGAGTDTLDGGTGADSMVGGTGNDAYVVENVGDAVTENPNEGTDSVQSSIAYTLGTNVENLILTGTTAINGTGNALNNILSGNSAANVLTGGAGDDTYIVGAGDTVVENANEGIDTVQSSLTYTLGANLENLTLTGTLAIDGTGNTVNNILAGNSANNTLNGGAGADSMTGGLGDDTYVVDNAGDTITENLNEGTDSVQSSVTYTLAANEENLALTGTTAINGTGNTLNNVLTGNSAANVLTGGAGDDTYVVGTGDTVVENANEGADTVQTSLTYTLGANVENLTLTGSAKIDGTGNALDNTLIGNNDNNTLTGGGGNDTLNGGGGKDTLVGGTGDDTYVVDSTNDVVTESAGQGTDTVETGMTYTLGGNVENLTLTGTSAFNGTDNALNNMLTGNGAVNTLTAGTGNDILQGGAGNDVLRDTAGNNLLNGGADADTLTGAAGNEIFIGGAGNDTITTGTGADLIAFNRGGGVDTINVSTVADNTLSLGGGIELTDLVFHKDGNNLVLDTGASEGIILKDWYANTANHSLLTLQMVEEAAADFNPSGGDTLRDNKIETFNFQGLADRFDQALAANPGLTSWALTQALTDFHLGGSDTAALGGDLAYQYGRNGNLSNVGLTAAQSILSDPAFGTGAQTFMPPASLQEGALRLS